MRKSRNLSLPCPTRAHRWLLNEGSFDALDAAGRRKQLWEDMHREEQGMGQVLQELGSGDGQAKQEADAPRPSFAMTTDSFASDAGLPTRRSLGSSLAPQPSLVLLTRAGASRWWNVQGYFRGRAVHVIPSDCPARAPLLIDASSSEGCCLHARISHQTIRTS